jgi:hypothetical protein
VVEKERHGYLCGFGPKSGCVEAACAAREGLGQLGSREGASFLCLKAQTRPPLRSAAAWTAISVKVFQNLELFSYFSDKADCFL